VTDRVIAALNRKTINPSSARIRSEGGHAWTLKGKCRFCGMMRVDFNMQKRPDCQWTAKTPKAARSANDKPAL
jgi:hypothetical protein